MIGFKYNDGGRRAAGFRGDAGDCVTRAIAIATGMPYADAYALVDGTCKGSRRRNASGTRFGARTGVHKRTTRSILASIGWEWIPTMRLGSGCTVHLRKDELPPGRIIVKLSRHVAAVIDGVLHDTSDCSRDGTRCVYGYFRKAER